LPPVLHTINQIAQQQPSQVALLFSGQDYSYSALNEAIARLRGALAARGVARGDRVVLLLPNCPHFIIAHLAVLGLGAVSVPLHFQSKAREITWALEDTEARALFAWSNLAPEVEKAASRLESPILRAYVGDNIPAGADNLLDLIASGQPLATDESLTDDDLAVVLYTAGASGFPRGAELSHGAFSTHAHELGRLLRIRETDRFCCALPFATACGLTLGVHLPLLHGARIDIHSRFHPGDLLRHMQDEQMTVLVGNPVAYATMAGFPSAEKHDLSHLRYALCCEAKLSEQIARTAEERLSIRIFEGYGTAETCGIVTLNLFPALQPRGSVGHPFAGHDISILDVDGAPARTDVTGQIAISGPCVMRGYRNRPDKTRQVLRDGWLLTGDRGYIDEQSNLFVTGHSGEMIIKGGFPIHAREVEEIVEGLPHVQEVAVVGVPDPVYGEEIKACVVLKDGASIGPGEIMEYVKERVALYKCPKIVKLYKELPRTAGGKIIRGQLREEKS
jgi:long-chain acyl-CoA synthetase